MELEHIMVPEVVRIAPDTPLLTLLQTLSSGETRRLYVVDPEGRLLGLVSRYDLLKRFLPEYLTANLSKLVKDSGDEIEERFQSCKQCSAKDLMTENVEYLTMDRGVVQAEAMLVQGRYNAVPVLGADRVLLGEVSRKSVLSYILRVARQD